MTINEEKPFSCIKAIKPIISGAPLLLLNDIAVVPFPLILPYCRRRLLSQASQWQWHVAHNNSPWVPQSQLIDIII